MASHSPTSASVVGAKALALSQTVQLAPTVMPVDLAIAHFNLRVVVA
jgi:hypothetical protein